MCPVDSRCPVVSVGPPRETQQPTGRRGTAPVTGCSATGAAGDFGREGMVRNGARHLACWIAGIGCVLRDVFTLHQEASAPSVEPSRIVTP